MLMPMTEPDRSLRDEVLAGLAARPRRLHCKLFYDLEGSRLFEEICAQPEYYLTRSEIDVHGRPNCSCARCWVNHTPRSLGIESNPHAWTIRAPDATAAS